MVNNTVADFLFSTLALSVSREVSRGEIVTSAGGGGRPRPLPYGVEVEPVDAFADDRGVFIEPAVGFSSWHVAMAVSFPGVVKAWHHHRKQTDVWVPLHGLIQVALCDLRESVKFFAEDSRSTEPNFSKNPFYGKKYTVFAGEDARVKITIPPGVAHGYKVVGGKPATLVYLTDRPYNPEDEGRLQWDDRWVAYDWKSHWK